ncbi:MAG TPA: AbrB/MazE/SpoVT family DNA-binding domain-containing protein [Candidatus Nanoarchaeia archaeon]|nr:AbrB/MazE/SpoVT family DNA-binding domain-containing protein [Candidatus Nanoarchaeia archaeon]
MEIITTSSRGQIVIPESMRKKHDIKEGTRLVLFDDGDKIIIEREEKIAAILKLNILTEDSG